MRTLVYKRTHTGDPDVSGRFGCNCCMGSVRAWDFDAVIGIGGIGAEPVREGIDRKITWIGIYPMEVGKCACGYPILVFEQFYLKDEKGRPLSDKAPKLAKRLFAENAPRRLVVESDKSDEIRKILSLAKTAAPSPMLLGRRANANQPRCRPRSRKKC